MFCYFEFEGKVYKIPLEKCYELRTEIERKIKNYTTNGKPHSLGAGE